MLVVVILHKGLAIALVCLFQCNGFNLDFPDTGPPCASGGDRGASALGGLGPPGGGVLCSSSETGCRPYICDTSPRHSNCLDQFKKLKEREQAKLVCPLCRGRINGWIKANPARQFMDSKTRRCSVDTCNYARNYLQLRKHARRKHPRVRPTDVDPERELKWRNFKLDREWQDLYSMQFDLDGIDR
ncbi:putative zinc finger, RING/FYVE/PHD-type containing protein [Tanacetum coccineum]